MFAVPSGLDSATRLTDDPWEDGSVDWGEGVAVSIWLWEDDGLDVGDERAAVTSAGRAMAMAVEMRWATTQPTIFSRVEVGPGAERRNR